MAEQLMKLGSQQSQTWQQAILDSADFTIVSTNLEGVIQTLNAGALQQLGYKPEEVIGKCTPIIFHDPREVAKRAQQLSLELGHTIEPSFEALVAKARSGITDENIWTYIRKDNSRFPVRLSMTALHDDTGNVAGFLGIGKDITEQQKIERSLHESEARFSGAFRHAAIGMALVSPTGHWLKANASLCDIVGYTESELLALTFQDITHPEDLELDLKYFKQILAGEISNYHMEKRYIHKQGHAVWILLSVSLVRTDDGQPLHIVAQIQDISQRKQSEAAFQQLNIDLERLIHERTAQLENAIETAEIANSAKSQFLAHMSHELRTPLNAILGFSQLIAQDEAMPEHLQKSLNIINRSGEHLLTLINEILSLSKIEAGQTILEETNFNFYDFLHSLYEMLQLEAQSKGLKLNMEWTDEIPEYLYADEQKLRQVLINLLSNAIKFTSQGEVALRVKLDSQDLSSSSPAYFLSFEVEDTGVGIAPGDLETVFDPFVQAQAGQLTNQGTGLGLSICRSFVKLMGGYLSASSQPGEGSCFYFRIKARPSQQGLAKGSLGKGIKDLTARQPRHRILIVEDHMENQQLLIDLLIPLGHEVRAVEDGQAAVNLWRTWHPDLIWMDIHLPNLDGLNATQQIKHLAASENRTPPIIIALTANAFDQMRCQAFESGCDDFVSKPYLLTDLLEIMTQHLENRPFHEESGSLLTSQRLESTHSNQLAPELIQGLSSEWKVQLRQAALCLDEQIVKELIAQIKPEHQEVADSLITLVDNFQFGKIISLTQDQ